MFLIPDGIDFAGIWEDEIVVLQHVHGLVHLAEWDTVHLELDLHGQAGSMLQLQLNYGPDRNTTHTVTSVQGNIS